MMEYCSSCGAEVRQLSVVAAHRYVGAEPDDEIICGACFYEPDDFDKEIDARE